MAIIHIQLIHVLTIYLSDLDMLYVYPSLLGDFGHFPGDLPETFWT